MTRIASSNTPLVPGRSGIAPLVGQPLALGRGVDDNLARPTGPAPNASSTRQAFQSAARNASLQAGRQAQALGVGTGGGGNVDPLAANALALPSRNPAGSAVGELGGLGGGGSTFEDRIFALMINVVEDMQKKVEARLQQLQSEAEAGAATAAAGGKDTGGESRNIEFEKIKFDMQKLSQMQQAMSNVLNTMDELAKNAIRNIKGG